MKKDGFSGEGMRGTGLRDEVRHDEGLRDGGLPPPHGGRLVNRLLTGEAREAGLAAWAALPRIALDAVATADARLIAAGAYSPIAGFMTRDDYESVVEEMHLANGLPWTIPITLTVDEETAARLPLDGRAALADTQGRPLAILQVEDIFRFNKAREAHFVYGTESLEHPGVAALYRRGDVAVGGALTWLAALDEGGEGGGGEGRGAEGSSAGGAGTGAGIQRPLTPAETRREFQARGWRDVVGFQTRNPIHRAHEYIQKCALELADGLLLHPLVGWTRREDIPAEVRMASYDVMIRNYYPRERVLLTGFPAAMRYAGPREAVFHALVRKNYGCRYFIVGRDHAGVGGFYDPYECQGIFRRFRPEQLGVSPLFFEPAFYCRACGGMATRKTCPHGPDQHVHLSGTQVRERLAAGEELPREFSRPEVAALLAAALTKNGPPPEKGSNGTVVPGSPPSA